MAARAAFTRSDGEIEVVKRIGFVAGEVLDRQAGDAGGDAARDIRGDVLRIVGKAALEIGVHRHVRGLGDFMEMREHCVARHGAVGIAIEWAKPELVVASALKPRPCR